MIIITEKNQHLDNSSTVHFEKCSVGLTSSMTFFVVSDQLINSSTIDVAFKEFKTYTIGLDNIVMLTRPISLTYLYYSTGKFIYKFHVLMESDIAGDWSDTLRISIGQETVNVTLHGSTEELDESMMISLQNMKQFISEEYIVAFRDSVPGSSEIDYVLYNRKMREMLLNIFDISSVLGSYKSLLSVLAYFGYGELLAIKEYWVSGDVYKATSITNSVLEQIDKHLAGFHKSNQLSLVYQINQFDSDDEDGIPTYLNVFANTDEILTKLWALERILEKEFLYLNTHIIDIVGEFQSAVALELSVILNEINVTDVAMNEETLTTVDYEIENLRIYINRHDVLIEPFVYEEKPDNSGDIQVIAGVTIGYQHDNIFEVLSTVRQFDEFDMLTRNYVGDFGLITMAILSDLSNYQSYKFMLLDVSDDMSIDNPVLFESRLFSIDRLVSLDKKIQIGCKNRSTVKLLVVLLDHFGNPTILGNSQNIQILHEQIDFFIAKYDTSGEIIRDLALWSTFKDTTLISSNIVVDNIQETLDVMTWNPDTNTPLMQIARYYESDFDQLSTYTNINQLNSIPLYELDNLPLSTWGHTYAVFVFDIIGDASQSAPRQLGLKTFGAEEFTIFDTTYNIGSDELAFITNYVSTINEFCLSNNDNIFNDFTWDMHWYCNDPDGLISDARPMLRARSKQSSYQTRFCEVMSMSHAPHADFPEQLFSQDIKTFSKVDAKLQFSITDVTTDTLTIINDSTTIIVDNVSILTIADVIILLRSRLGDEGFVYIEANDCLHIWSKNDLSISHSSFGLQYDIVRSTENSSILRIPIGSDIKLGEPVFAFINQDKRIELSDTTWTLRNALNNAIVSVQHAYSFRWILSAKGSYSLTLSAKDSSGAPTSTKHGCIIVI